jgi:Bacterial Ig-like domain
MRKASVINAFKLFRKGSTNQIAATVSYDAATDTATLNPTNNLRRGATYKAVVSTVAKAEAGNRLDQNSSKSGLQKKVWFFEIDN